MAAASHGLWLHGIRSTGVLDLGCELARVGKHVCILLFLLFLRQMKENTLQYDMKC